MTNVMTWTWTLSEGDRIAEYSAYKDYLLREGQKLCDRYGKENDCEISIDDFTDVIEDNLDFAEEDIMDLLERELQYYVTH